MALLQPYRLRAALLVALVAAGLAAVLFGLLERSSPPLPAASPQQIGAAIGPLQTGASTPVQITALQRSIRVHSRDAELWAALGSSYYQRVRETGDFSFYTRAQGVLNTALRLDPRSSSALVGLATIALARHDFRAGLAYARRAHRLEPEANAAYPGIVDGLVETGQYRAAGRTIQEFLNRVPTLSSYARLSYFRELHGDLDGALQAMQYAISAGGSAPENVAYVQTLLGSLEFFRGRLSAAGRADRIALAQVPGYPQALVYLAEVQAAEGHLSAAITTYRDAVNRLPLPQYVTELGDAELAAGKPAQAQRDFALIGAEERLLAANGVNTDVDLALFEANHGSPARAVVLGRRSWAAPSVRSADARGWALTQAGRPAEGLGWARRALMLGSRDPNFLYHAGIAAARSGDRTAARRYLTAAVSLNPRFSPLYGPRAERALKALR